MPELDYMVLADYVRQDAGVIHIMGAGVDTVTAPAVPTVQPFGVALRITEDEVTTALNRPSGPPAPGDNGNIVRFGHCGSRILKIVLTADEETIVSVMPVGEG